MPDDKRGRDSESVPAAALVHTPSVRQLLRRVGRAEQPRAPLDYAYDRRGVVRRNRVRVLRDGGMAYPAMLEAIERANRSALLETYIFRPDRTGRRFLDALAGAARRGVEVKLFYDDAGSITLTAAHLAPLVKAGGLAAPYRPIAPWRPKAGLWRRDHRKILAVDGELGFLGGLNIADDYAAVADGGLGWHDLHLAIEGPAARELDALFRDVWRREVAEPGPPPEAGPVTLGTTLDHLLRGGVTPVQIIANDELADRWLIRRSTLYAINSAQRSVLIANPYFVPDAGVMRALVGACARGVDVRVLVPQRSDVRMVDYASRATFHRLLDGGVRIAEWTESMLHAKAVVIDGVWCSIGSYNFDHRSLLHNLEVTAIVYDDTIASALDSELRDDLARALPIDADAWRSRSVLTKLLQHIAYWFRKGL